MGKYTLYVDDNFHYLDADARRAARMIVDDFLRDTYRIGMTPEELLACYKAYGEEPWLSGSDFSAWTYAEQRCWEMCVG